MSIDSLDHWIERLNDGDADAIEHVSSPMRLLAYRGSEAVGPRLRTKVDSMDIVQSVFPAPSSIPRWRLAIQWPPPVACLSSANRLVAGSPTAIGKISGRRTVSSR